MKANTHAARSTEDTASDSGAIPEKSLDGERQGLPHKSGEWDDGNELAESGKALWLRCRLIDHSSFRRIAKWLRKGVLVIVYWMSTVSPVVVCPNNHDFTSASGFRSICGNAMEILASGFEVLSRSSVADCVKNAFR
jgi:hypothetical protein